MQEAMAINASLDSVLSPNKSPQPTNIKIPKIKKARKPQKDFSHVVNSPKSSNNQDDTARQLEGIERYLKLGRAKRTNVSNLSRKVIIKTNMNEEKSSELEL